ncbi:deoxyguanosinetriphosphate triphosphohydrolase [Cytophaga hutchinsonii]|uniref:Deoxyguanosinetriphosphate triphosphohydrolase n=1 Tax=Cytophaga hutchinsonii (strain ATCC 33406 / DSM 1761 / CIP 103989 / NBRC 15051 / NCIMB 9469 / D465) TaxID=269798 RepID=A0A6N4SSS9_CYTH3|nr:deoxyguanosinetriphosphate triphosphohydrolase [Cytophaga hutchinsonii]ABG59364.1 deoxyguanosinetriphosphate triphosphohydrolase [Cytophaga hutchinsonii ATCC 33406]SFX92393.1 dGTPase [Cytophaga hutchinsonii ATCC 33406]
MLDWKKLYSPKRLGAEGRLDIDPDSIRNPYQRDYDRLIFSSAFRRLQNKTQVFPLPGSIFVHNRLTHSLEVACVGRSIGSMIGQRIAKAYHKEDEDFQRFYNYELGSVISAACLAHDIGNPPFGHSGEKAISAYFKQLSKEETYILKQKVSENQYADLIHFEGNANGLRLLTHPFNENSGGGMRLTYTTIASMIKYPCEARAGHQKEILHRKKYGFFDSEKETFQKIVSEFDLISISTDEQIAYARHPFVYLVEAADDICYQIIDWEDAYRLKIISLEKAIDGLLTFFPEEGTHTLSKAKRVVEKIVDPNQKIAYLRATVINLLLENCVDVFWKNQQEILEGKYEKSLTDDLNPEIAVPFNTLKEISIKEIYNYRSVVEIELAGYKILGGLLEEFIPAVLYPDRPNAEKLLQLLPPQFVYQGEDLYLKLQSVIDFISGMTDIYAVDLYRKIKGIALPELK